MLADAAAAALLAPTAPSTMLTKPTAAALLAVVEFATLRSAASIPEPGQRRARYPKATQSTRVNMVVHVALSCRRHQRGAKAAQFAPAPNNILRSRWLPVASAPHRHRRRRLSSTGPSFRHVPCIPYIKLIHLVMVSTSMAAQQGKLQRGPKVSNTPLVGRGFVLA